MALLGALVLAAVGYLATARWRAHLLEESARSRRVVAAVEGASQARVERRAREQALERTLRSRPEDVDARMELARLRWEEVGPQGAAAVLQGAGPGLTDTRALRMLAGAQRLMGRPDQALATLDRAVRAAPELGDLQAERALLFSLIGWFPQARQALQAGERHGADPVQTALVRATMARQQGDLRTARRELEAARTRAPEEIEVIRQLAAVAESEGRPAEAVQLLEPIAETAADPDLWVALARLSLLVETPSARARAIAAAHRALALRPQQPSARVFLARALRLEGRREEAQRLLETLRRERPHQVAAAFELAQLYRDLGMNEKAAPLLAEYQESLRRNEVMRRAGLAVMEHPENAQAHLEMGRLYLDRGRVGEAILSLERALELQPGLPGAQEALDRAKHATSRESTQE
jgi:tetratricopeptide (TPR) repeat protein